MAATALASKIQERIDCFCMHHLGIAVATPTRNDWDDMPMPATLLRSGWIDPAETDGHESGFVFIYCPEVIAETVRALHLGGINRYLETLLTYVELFVTLAEEIPVRDVRRHEVEHLIYDDAPEALSLLSDVQFGHWRGRPAARWARWLSG